MSSVKEMQLLEIGQVQFQAGWCVVNDRSWGDVGWQNLPLQITYLLHDDLFRLIIFKALKAQDKP